MAVELDKESCGGIHLTMEKEEYVFPFERINSC